MSEFTALMVWLAPYCQVGLVVCLAAMIPVLIAMLAGLSSIEKDLKRRG